MKITISQSPGILSNICWLVKCNPINEETTYNNIDVECKIDAQSIIKHVPTMNNDRKIVRRLKL